MYKFLTQDRKIAVRKMFSDVDANAVNHDIVLNSIKDAFNSGIHDIVLYYSGHGRQRDGAWCFEVPNSNGHDNAFLKPADILSAWRTRRRGVPDQQLIIISDSCHSGWWVDAAKERKDKQIIVQAACDITECSYDSPTGGVFTQQYVQGLDMNHEACMLPDPINWFRKGFAGAAWLIGGVFRNFASFVPQTTHCEGQQRSTSIRVGSSSLRMYSGWATLDAERTYTGIGGY
eukprot:TRINITY_DN91510_c0_g1_i1.p1 TRINITY_DN91510_c0_g1~~TRINITY_DN91510_c0_g1_i1.p1  ORF type:complete len:231 (-),score=12.31 TRINITY_DN91510_c0_g1_i1:165-857(-)